MQEKIHKSNKCFEQTLKTRELVSRPAATSLFDSRSLRTLELCMCKQGEQEFRIVEFVQSARPGEHRSFGAHVPLSDPQTLSGATDSHITDLTNAPISVSLYGHHGKVETRAAGSRGHDSLGASTSARVLAS